MRKRNGNEDVTVIPQLCIALHCLPSQIAKEDYNDIVNILSTFSAQAKLQKAQERKSKRR